MGARGEEWQRLRQDVALGSEPIPDCARLWLRPDARAMVADLVEQEAACCGFLDFELDDGGDRLRLDITSPVTEARPIISSLVGLVGDRPTHC